MPSAEAGEIPLCKIVAWAKFSIDASRLRSRSPEPRRVTCPMKECLPWPTTIIPSHRPIRALRVKALESLLVEKAIIDPDVVGAFADYYEHRVGPRNGAKVVARAWSDPAYKQRLLANGTAAIAELSFGGLQGEEMVVVENTSRVHNVVTCTLCSCYPWPTLGLPPTWYKSPAYRSRIVIEPRSVLAEFGLEILRRGRGARLRQQRRNSLPRPADAAGRNGRLERGQACRTGHPRRDDRHGPAAAASVIFASMERQ